MTTLIHINRKSILASLALCLLSGTINHAVGFERLPDADFDLDGIPGAVDPCPSTPDPSCGNISDADGDSIIDQNDNCIFDFNPGQQDGDGDGIGDACDADTADADGDGIPDGTDNCPATPNSEQRDADEDGIGDSCDDELGPIPSLTITARGDTKRVWSTAGRVEFLIVNNGPVAAENVQVDVDLSDYLDKRGYNVGGLATRMAGDGWECTYVDLSASSSPISTCTRQSIGPAGSGEAATSLWITGGGITSPQSVYYQASIVAGDNLPDDNYAEITITFVPPKVELILNAQQTNLPTLADGAISRYFFASINLGPEHDNNLQTQFTVAGPAEIVSAGYSYLRSDGTKAGGTCLSEGTSTSCGRVYARQGQTVEYTVNVAGTATTGTVTLHGETFSNATDLDPANNVVSLTIPALTRPLLNQIQTQNTSGTGFEFSPYQDFEVSSDGNHVYTANSMPANQELSVGASITIYERDSVTGVLTRSGGILDGIDGSWSRLIALSPDGGNIYMARLDCPGCSAFPTDASLRGILVYDRSSATGELTLAQTLLLSDLGIPADPGHFDLEVSGDGLEVYLLIADRLLVFDRNVSTGSLALSQIFDEPTVQAISSNFEGDGVFLNEPSNKEIRLLRRDPLTNNLSPVATIARGYRVDSFWPQKKIEPTLNGRNLLVPDDNSTGGSQLSVMLFAPPQPGDMQWWLDYRWPTRLDSVEVSQDAQHVFVAGTSFVAILDQDLACGELALRETYADQLGNTSDLYEVRNIRTSPDGRHLYAASWGGTNAGGILVFEIDSDRDGIPNATDPSTLTQAITDCPANRDSDGDSVPNASDAFPIDPNQSVDADLDRVDDALDNCTNVANADQLDNDRDGIGDACDSDDDNDGTIDLEDDFPCDPAEQTDTDGDTLGNNADTDDDNDSLLDVNDNCPTTANPGQQDLDGDGDGDACDDDADGDGVPNMHDDFPLDASESADTDADGVGNNADEDDDGDGLSDVEEMTIGTNPLVSDSDADGISDSNEVQRGTDPLAADTDGDSMPDGLEVEQGLNPLDDSDCPKWFCGGLSPILIKVILEKLAQ